MAFKIAGVGRANKVLIRDGKEVALTFENAPHSPNMSCDLISISEIDQKRYKVLFGIRDGETEFYSLQGDHFLMGALWCLVDRKLSSVLYPSPKFVKKFEHLIMIEDLD
jgi:hypothetical protein